MKPKWKLYFEPGMMGWPSSFRQTWAMNLLTWGMGYTGQVTAVSRPTYRAAGEHFEVGVLVHVEHQVDHVPELGRLDRLVVDVHVFDRKHDRAGHDLELGAGLHGAPLDLALDEPALQDALRVAVDVLDGQADGLFEALLVRGLRDIVLAHLLHEAAALVVVEGHVVGQVVPVEGRNGHELDAVGVREARGPEVAAHVRLDVLEGLAVPVVRVHLVDRHDQVLDVHALDDLDVLLGLALVQARLEAPARRVCRLDRGPVPMSRMARSTCEAPRIMLKM